MMANTGCYGKYGNRHQTYLGEGVRSGFLEDVMAKVNSDKMSKVMTREDTQCFGKKVPGLRSQD